MSPLSVVEELQVVEELGARRGPRGPRGVVDEFDLHRREEALGDGVVPAVAPTAHTADDPMLGQQPLVVAARVLGEFNRSSQQLSGRGCDDETEAVFSARRTRHVTLARPTIGWAA